MIKVIRKKRYANLFKNITKYKARMNRFISVRLVNHKKNLLKLLNLGSLLLPQKYKFILKISKEFSNKNFKLFPSLCRLILKEFSIGLLRKPLLGNKTLFKKLKLDLGKDVFLLNKYFRVSFPQN